MVNHAEGSLHQWLNLTLAAGGALVVFGVARVDVSARLRRRDVLSAPHLHASQDTLRALGDPDALSPARGLTAR